MSESAVDYESAKGLATDADPSARCALAANPDSPPEILYFLADDDSVEVRRAVAANPSTPRKADTKLAKDKDISVRCELARKIVGEGLGDEERGELWRIGFTILETLATDQVKRVRRALAEAMTGVSSAPRSVALGLARDPEPEVATPVLRHSPVLTEDDLAEIAAGDAPDWARAAIAGRDDIGPRVTEAIAAGDDVPAVTKMLRNHRADIPDAAIERLAERARHIEPWHEPLVARPRLTARAVLKLASFVSGALLTALKGRDKLDPETKKALNEIDERRGGADRRGAARIAQDSANGAGTRRKTKRKRAAAGGRGTRDSSAGRGWETPGERALRLYQAGRLNDEIVELAMESRELDFVTAAIALRSQLPQDLVRSILSAQSARMVTALCWKAGFKMRFAIDVQRRVARIPPSKLLYARDGYDYPLSPDEMTAQLEFLIR